MKRFTIMVIAIFLLLFGFEIFCERIECINRIVRNGCVALSASGVTANPLPCNSFTFALSLQPEALTSMGINRKAQVTAE